MPRRENIALHDGKISPFGSGDQLFFIQGSLLLLSVVEQLPRVGRRYSDADFRNTSHAPAYHSLMGADLAAANLFQSVAGDAVGRVFDDIDFHHGSGFIE